MSTREQDHYLWSVETARALRQGDLEHIDTLALAEELEQVSRADAHELDSRIAQILEHLLKLRLIAGQTLRYNQIAWRESVRRQQGEIESLVETSPSLKRRLTADVLAKCYQRAVRVVAGAFEVTPPADCPFGWTEILGGDGGNEG